MDKVKGYMLIGYEVRQKELLAKAFGTLAIIIGAFCLCFLSYL